MHLDAAGLRHGRGEGRILLRLDRVGSQILDVAPHDPQRHEWSARVLENAAERGTLRVNPIIYVEVSIAYRTIKGLERLMPGGVFRRDALPYKRTAGSRARRTYGTIPARAAAARRFRWRDLDNGVVEIQSDRCGPRNLDPRASRAPMHARGAGGESCASAPVTSGFPQCARNRTWNRSNSHSKGRQLLVRDRDQPPKIEWYEFLKIVPTTIRRSESQSSTHQRIFWCNANPRKVQHGYAVWRPYVIRSPSSCR
jgi:hypothetical protein